MKMRERHIVPLSKQALALLRLDLELPRATDVHEVSGDGTRLRVDARGRDLVPSVIVASFRRVQTVGNWLSLTCVAIR